MSICVTGEQKWNPFLGNLHWKVTLRSCICSHNFFFIKNIDTSMYRSHSCVLRQPKCCWHDKFRLFPDACLGYLRPFDKKYVHHVSLYNWWHKLYQPASFEIVTQIKVRWEVTIRAACHTCNIVHIRNAS